MEKENNSLQQTPENQRHDIPDIAVIDLEDSDGIDTKDTDD